MSPTTRPPFFAVTLCCLLSLFNLAQVDLAHGQSLDRDGFAFDPDRPLGVLHDIYKNYDPKKDPSQDVMRQPKGDFIGDEHGFHAIRDDGVRLEYHITAHQVFAPVIRNMLLHYDVLNRDIDSLIRFEDETLRRIETYAPYQHDPYYGKYYNQLKRYLTQLHEDRRKQEKRRDQLVVEIRRLHQLIKKNAHHTIQLRGGWEDQDEATRLTVKFLRSNPHKFGSAPTRFSR